ncbi:unnamed protein product [Lactuca virosa]|uniref:AB hydrolase-1 domain-containing protein n=1 Tax=Lactuca virosa TaxID=75947 RepID=A0AAU9PGY2_9ASTR|nr:unnamed protein product [Lactuca virosa]
MRIPPNLLPGRSNPRPIFVMLLAINSSHSCMLYERLKVIGGEIGMLLEQNHKSLDQISANLSALKHLFINTFTFDSKEDSPTLVMVHGYAAAQGFFFINFDALTKHFRVIAMDQLGWGGSS